ncbi:DUF4249 family protein [Thermophagus sp. OGC60D27]|uniref:DUF4249 family protein n=1 Tax=Thermophagus sp. OGC60D27 TaxID=3458415 RepID=UPI00403799B5
MVLPLHILKLRRHPVIFNVTKFLLPIALISITILSCRKEVELEQPAYQQKMVVDGYIETGQPAHVFLTMSSPFLTHYDSVSIRASFLNYAKITLSSSLGEEEVLTLFRENSFFPPYVYKSVHIKGEEGVQYQIKVEGMGQILKAETTIPPAVEIVGTRFVEISDTTGFWEFAIDAPDRESLYLFTRVKSSYAEENFHPSFNPVSLVKASQSGPVWHRLLRTSEFGLYLRDAESTFYGMYEQFEYDRRDTLKLIVGTIDSASYRVLESLFADRANHENPFAFNGNTIETNIEGGIGRWTGVGFKEVAVLFN